MRLRNLWNRMSGRMIKGIVAAGVGVSAAALVWNSYQNGGIFNPDAYADTQEVQDNQVIFPEDDEYSQDDDGQGDSDLWEKNRQSEERLSPEDMPDSSVLFETEGKLIDPGIADHLVAGTDDPAGVPGDGEGGNILVPGGDSNGIKVPDGTFGPDGQENGNGGGGNNNENGGGGSHPSVDPEPPVKDPDKKPELPDDLYEDFGGSETFPEGGISEDTQQGNVDISWQIFDAIDWNPVYYGQILDDWKLLCGIYVYVYVTDDAGNTTIYRMENYNENFKIGSFPDTATKNFSVDFYFRPNKDSEWQVASHNFAVKPYKVVLKGWEGNEDIRDWYPASGETLDLTMYYSYVLPDEWFDMWEPVELTEIFPGWSESEGGRPVPIFYTPGLPGRHVLYPLPVVPVPQGLNVVMEFNWDTFSMLQTLKGCEENSDQLNVPDGIGSIDTYGITVKEIVIPNSVLSMRLGEKYLKVTESYQVAEDNLNYSSRDGMLFNKDESVLYAVPAEKKIVTIPDTVTYAELQENSIEKLYFKADKPIGINFENLHNAEIYVPAEAYLDYLTAWGESLGDNKLFKDDGSQGDVIVSNGAILSTDGKILYKVLESVGGTYVVPDNVETIKKGALDACGDFSLFVLPDSIKVLEDGSISGSVVAQIICQGEVPPHIEKGTFGNLDILKVQVPEGKKETYISLWGGILGRETAERIVTEGSAVIVKKDGYTYLQQEDGAVLMEVPKDIVYFNENSLPGVTVKQIGSKAFAGSGSLVAVEIPESVSYIGAGAFENCGLLQGVVSRNTDSITIGDGAFAGCPEVRIMAFNAAYAVFENGFYPDGWGDYYAPNGASGYDESLFKMECSSYGLKEQGNGWLLYGRNERGGYLLGATTDISGEIVLEQGTLSIEDDALSQCKGSYTLNKASMAGLQYIGNNAFNGSGIGGEIVLPDSIRYLGSYAFYDCKGITSIYIDGPFDLKSDIGDSAFAGCTSLEDITFADRCGVKEIGVEAFWSTSIRTIQLPDQVETIRSGAFGDTPLTEFVMPSSVETLYYSVFEGCSQLKRVEFQSQVPPRLVRISYGPQFAFTFGENLPADFRIVLAGDAKGKEETYIEAWKYGMIGYDSADADTLTPELILKATNIVRRLLGLQEQQALAFKTQEEPVTVQAEEEVQDSSTITEDEKDATENNTEDVTEENAQAEGEEDKL